MNRSSFLRSACMFVSGAVMLQFAGCTTNDAFEFLQTVFLGVTAAGSFAILRNI